MSNEQTLLLRELDRLDVQMDILGEPPALEAKRTEIEAQLKRLTDKEENN